MIINKMMNQKELDNEIKHCFIYYDDYKKYLDEDLREINKFCIMYAKNLIEIPNRTLDVNERNSYVNKAFEALDFPYIETENEQCLIFQEYKQFKWIADGYQNNDYIREQEKYFENKVEENTRGIKCQTNIKSLFKKIAGLPFLMNYRDIDILIYKKDYFYKINHHLTLFKIKVVNALR